MCSASEGSAGLAEVAQLVEHRSRKAGVTGSSPVFGSPSPRGGRAGRRCGLLLGEDSAAADCSAMSIEISSDAAFRVVAERFLEAMVRGGVVSRMRVVYAPATVQAYTRVLRLHVLVNRPETASNETVSTGPGAIHRRFRS
jgi:hypothetical protein